MQTPRTADLAATVAGLQKKVEQYEAQHKATGSGVTKSKLASSRFYLAKALRALEEATAEQKRPSTPTAATKDDKADKVAEGPRAASPSPSISKKERKQQQGKAEAKAMKAPKTRRTHQDPHSHRRPQKRQRSATKRSVLKLGLIFRWSRVARMVRDALPQLRISKLAPIYLTAFVEQVCTAVLEGVCCKPLSSGSKKQNDTRRVTPRAIALALVANKGLLSLASNGVVAGGGRAVPPSP